MFVAVILPVDKRNGAETSAALLHNLLSLLGDERQKRHDGSAKVEEEQCVEVRQGQGAETDLRRLGLE